MQDDVIQRVLESIERADLFMEDPTLFTMQLFSAFNAQQHLIDILFSGTQASVLPIRIESALKEHIFRILPNTRDDARFNIFLTYQIQGGYYAYSENRRRFGDRPVLDTLKEIMDLLHTFHEQPKTLLMPEILEGSFAKKLYSTYLSYLPEDAAKFALKMNCDDRGSFTELLKTRNCGQFSVNISKPGITKGEHWHHSKWEFFIVVSGHGLIQERKVGLDEQGNPYPVQHLDASGEKIEAVHMLPGYTHKIVNLLAPSNLTTLMWHYEQYDRQRPDTTCDTVSSDGT